MRAFGKWVGSVLAFLFLVLAGLWAFGPRDTLNPASTFDAKALPADLDAYLSQREAVFSDITPGTAKRIVWAGAAGVQTPLAIVYLHGFSATSEEIRPVPDEVAKALGANLYFARLAGHGRDGAALAAARAEDWMVDLDEALAIGRRIGGRVIVISTSTGGTLATLAALDPARAEGLAGVVLVSPNYRLASAASAILDLPFAPHWAPLVAGAERSFTPHNADHGTYWTTRYPTTALFSMATLMRYVRGLDPKAAKVPALFYFAPQDQVVDAATTAKVAAAWGAKATVVNPTLGADDDRYAHVIAGRVLSPGQTAPAVKAILDWAAGL